MSKRFSIVSFIATITFTGSYVAPARHRFTIATRRGTFTTPWEVRQPLDPGAVVRVQRVALLAEPSSAVGSIEVAGGLSASAVTVEVNAVRREAAPGHDPTLDGLREV